MKPDIKQRDCCLRVLGCVGVSHFPPVHDVHGSRANHGRLFMSSEDERRIVVNSDSEQSWILGNCSE
jgi:hypothetical protein